MRKRKGGLTPYFSPRTLENLGLILRCQGTKLGTEFQGDLAHPFSLVPYSFRQRKQQSKFKSSRKSPLSLQADFLQLESRLLLALGFGGLFTVSGTTELWGAGAHGAPCRLRIWPPPPAGDVTSPK